MKNTLLRPYGPFGSVTFGSIRGRPTVPLRHYSDSRGSVETTPSGPTGTPASEVPSNYLRRRRLGLISVSDFGPRLVPGPVHKTPTENFVV